MSVVPHILSLLRKQESPRDNAWLDVIRCAPFSASLHLYPRGVWAMIQTNTSLRGASVASNAAISRAVNDVQFRTIPLLHVIPAEAGIQKTPPVPKS